MNQDADFRRRYVERVRGAFGLTPRQAEIVYWVRCGMRNNRVAETMGICIGTVKSHLHAVFMQVGVGSKPELIATVEDSLGESEETAPE